MDFLELLKSFLSSLGISTEKAGNKQMTPEEITKLSASVKEKTGMELNEFFLKVNEQIESAKKNDESKQAHQATLDTIAGIISTAIPSSQNAEGNNGEGGENTEGSQATSQQVIDAAQQMATAFQQMANGATPQTPIATSAPVIGLMGPGTTTTHLFGIENELFSLKHRWNQLAADPNSVTSKPDEEVDGPAFQQSVVAYGKSLHARFQTLQKENKLGAIVNSAFTNDYSGLNAANLGDQYIIRRQDAIIARLIKAASVYHLFPRRYGIQDRELLISAFFDKVSQAWQRGQVFKGAMQLQPEVGHVDDAMIKLNFPPMEEIERSYIGYTNKEGSDAMKLSMIEFQYESIMLQAISEQNERKIMGIYVAPETGVPGHHLHASTGVVYTIIRLMHEMKMKAHNDDAFIGYADTTMLKTVIDYCKAVKDATRKDKTVSFKDMELYLNEEDQYIWKLNCRAEYGKDIDFTGPDSMLHKVPDLNTKINWVPNLGSVQLMLMQEPGNIQSLENLPGEMLSAKMQSQMEEILFWTRWKEGTAAEFVGVKFNSKQELDSNNFHMQRVFCNTPCSYLADDATTADANNGFWFRSPDNNAATKLTDIENAEQGIAYIIEVGGTNNITAIDKAGKFDQILSNYVPTQKEDYIMVVLNSDGDKFFELERTVGGVRTINKKLQPNIPGAR